MELKPGMFVYTNSKQILTIKGRYKYDWWEVLENDYKYKDYSFTPITKIKIRLSDDMELNKKILKKAKNHGLYVNMETLEFGAAHVYIYYDGLEELTYTPKAEEGHFKNHEATEFTPEQYLGEEIEKPETLQSILADALREVEKIEEITGNGEIDVDFRVIPRDWLPAEVHQDKELNRRLLMATLHAEEYKQQQYQCPYCKYSGSKEKVNDHCKREHQETIGMSSVLWGHLKK